MKLLLLFLLFWTVPSYAETVSLKSLTDQFNAVVFIHEHGKTGREAKPLVKWKGPIRYSPAGTLTRDQVDKFFALMKRIEKLSGLDMRMVKKGEKANLIVHFLPRAELEKKVKPGINCFGKLGVDASYTITSGRAYIPSDRPDKTDHCLVEETVQLFGLTNDSTLMANSMFHEKSKRTSLSVADQILLKTLYDSRLKVGMNREEAQPVLRQILSETLQKIQDKQKGRS